MASKTILLGFDGSRHSERALRVAVELARAGDRKLAILCVEEPVPLSAGLQAMAEVEHTARPASHEVGTRVARLPGWFADTLDEARPGSGGANIAEQLMAQSLERAKLSAQAGGVSDVTLLSRKGHAAAEILHCAEELDAAMIFLGSRGLGDIRSLLFGSVAKSVAHALRDHRICVVVSEGAED